jgi:hypothetical protein
MAMKSDALGVASGEESGARGCADGRGDMEVGETDAICCNGIDVRGLDGFRTEATEVAVALVIGEDDDDIRITRERGQGEKC